MADISYLDFDLAIERASDGYRVEVNSPAGQSASALQLPFSDLELENFLLKIGQARRVMRRIDAPETEAAKAFGARLFEAVFSGEPRACLRSSLDEAGRQGKGLRIRMRLNDAPELAGLPWEYLYNSALNRFFALSIETPIVRYLELPERIRPLAVAVPLRILAIIASPRDQAPLDVEREWQRLREALGELEQRGLVRLERLEQPSLAELQRRLRRSEYHILHFVGHGGFDEHSQDGVLLLEDRAGLSYRISGQDLGTLLHDHRTLRLAVLNSCDGARGSRTDPFGGTAQSLVQQGLPAVIAMQFEVSDQAAIALAHEFYGAIADGYPVDAALAEARKALFAAQSGVEWGTPVLYLRAEDARIFDMAPLAVSPIQPPVLPPTPSERPGEPEWLAAPAANRSGATIQGRLAAMGCQANLLIQFAALFVILAGAGFAFMTVLGGKSSSIFSSVNSGLGGNTSAPAATRSPDRTATVPTTPAATTAQPTAAQPTYAAWAGITAPLATITTTAQLNTVAVSPDGKLLAAGGVDNVISIWDLATYTLVRELEQSLQQPDTVNKLAFSPDGTLLASAGTNIHLWNMATGKLAREFSSADGHTALVETLAFAPSGALLASGSIDQTIKIWRVDDGAVLRTLSGHTTAVMGVAFSPDSRLLASGAFDNVGEQRDAQVRLWRVDDGTLIRTLDGPTRGVLSVAFSPNGATLAAGSWDNSAYLWRVADGTGAGRLEGSTTNGIYDLAFSPDGTSLAIGGGDGGLRLFAIADQRQICVLVPRDSQGDQAWLTGVVFTPDGRRLITSSYDMTLRIWGLSS